MRITTSERSHVDATYDDTSDVAPIKFPPLNKVTRPCVTTSEAAFYLMRRPRTLHVWACHGKGPINPIRVNGRLAWSVDEIRKLVGEVA